MALTDDTTETDVDGVTEWKVVEAFNEVSGGSDRALEWKHWRTSQNYTCMRDEDDIWVVQFGRNNPVVSVMHLGKGINGTVILQSPEDAILLMLKAARNPKDALIEIVERSDEHGVFVQKHEGEPSPEQMRAARRRQEAWGDRATETPTRNEGDVGG